MANIYTIPFKSQCSGGTHYTFSVKRGTTTIDTVTVTLDELSDTQLDVRLIVLQLMKLAVSTGNPTTISQARTLINAISVTA